MRFKKTVAFSLMTVGLFTSGCSSASGSAGADLLSPGDVYVGVNGTSQAIKVNSNGTWTITKKNKDTSEYTIAEVSSTGEKIDDYDIVNVIATEIQGYETPFAKTEGRDYFILKSEDELFLGGVSSDSMDNISEDILNASDPEARAKELANFSFEKK